MQPPVRPSFALANFQLGRKGQRPKGRKVKRPNFQKLSEAIFTKSKVVHNVFMSIFKLKGPISRNFALELIVQRPEIYLLDIYETQIKPEILHFSALLVSPSPLEKGKKSGF